MNRKMNVSNRDHWENVYKTKAEDEMSWYQPVPKTSFYFLDNFQIPLTANIIDVGGGDSRFVDALIEKGYTNISVLDISANAIEKAKKRLGNAAKNVNWIISDIRNFQPKTKFDFWHDRATFHFLTEEKNVNNYVSLAANAIKDSGFLVLGTFSETGPTMCSGLNIKQYSETSMTAGFEKDFNKIKCKEEVHKTPSNKEQNFIFCSFQKRMAA